MDERKKKVREKIDLLVAAAMENQSMASSGDDPNDAEEFRKETVDKIMNIFNEVISEEMFDRAYFGDVEDAPKQPKLPLDPEDLSKVWVDPLPTGKFDVSRFSDIPIGKTFTVILGKDCHEALIANQIEHECESSGCFDGPRPYDGPGSNEWARKNPAPGITHL